MVTSSIPYVELSNFEKEDVEIYLKNLTRVLMKITILIVYITFGLPHNLLTVIFSYEDDNLNYMNIKLNFRNTIIEELKYFNHKIYIRILKTV